MHLSNTAVFLGSTLLAVSAMASAEPAAVPVFFVPISSSVKRSDASGALPGPALGAALALTVMIGVNELL
ncbi:hypothetical protein C8034_v005686 [Colletotrichum sidae]|uniref:Uncharacterized protein n=1 Tax=Colletotrichum sidae TaxID=1347389 RepID=A0A4R8TRJ2_9PEZI|nr:hypothetical protein C8034_v005686 [Colletotrichum sidae]